MEHKIICPHCLARLPEGKKVCTACGRGLQNHNPIGGLPFASLLADRYTIGEFLSNDGEGLFYSAIENSSAVRVVIKEYYPVTFSENRQSDGSIYPKDDKAVLFKTTRMDFSDLYHTLQHITPATGLVAVLDVFEANNTVYAVMEHVHGMQLDEYLSVHGGVLSPAEARSLLQPVMEGVAEMHKAGLIHRGISPDNICIEDGGMARLDGYATLGLRTAGSELRPKLYEGYSAPEQYTLDEFEGLYTDVYALAAVFFHLVTGTTPVPGNQRRVQDSLLPAHEIVRSVPSYVSDVLGRSMATEPSGRIQNVPQLMSALASSDAANALMEHPKKAPSRALRFVTGLLVAIAVLLLLVLFLLLRRDAPSHTPDSASTSDSAASNSDDIIDVPKFVGQTFTAVQRDPDYSAYYRFSVTESYSSEYEKGLVMSQDPEAGSVWDSTGDPIHLVISKGPELVEMPYIIGFPRENAQKELNERGIKYSLLVLTNNGEYATDCVVRTDVEAGTAFDAGQTTVNVYIAGERQTAASEEAVSVPEEPPATESQAAESTAENPPENETNTG